MVELHVPDFKLAWDYYRLLKYELTRLEQSYMVLRRAENILCFYGGSREPTSHHYFGRFTADSPRGVGVEIILFEEDIKAYYEEVKDTVEIAAALSLKRWGQWDFRLVDPFGFYLRVSQRYDITTPTAEAAARIEEVASSKGISRT